MWLPCRNGRVLNFGALPPRFASGSRWQAFARYGISPWFAFTVSRLMAPAAEGSEADFLYHRAATFARPGLSAHRLPLRDGEVFTRTRGMAGGILMLATDAGSAGLMRRGSRVTIRTRTAGGVLRL